MRSVLLLKLRRTQRMLHNARLHKHNRLLRALRAPRIRLCKRRRRLRPAATRPIRDWIACSSSRNRSKIDTSKMRLLRAAFFCKPPLVGGFFCSLLFAQSPEIAAALGAAAAISVATTWRASGDRNRLGNTIAELRDSLGSVPIELHTALFRRRDVRAHEARERRFLNRLDGRLGRRGRDALAVDAALHERRMRFEIQRAVRCPTDLHRLIDDVARSCPSARSCRALRYPRGTCARNRA